MNEEETRKLRAAGPEMWLPCYVKNHHDDPSARPAQISFEVYGWEAKIDVPWENVRIPDPRIPFGGLLRAVKLCDMGEWSIVGIESKPTAYSCVIKTKRLSIHPHPAPTGHHHHAR